MTTSGQAPECPASGRERWASARPINTSPIQSDAAYETATCMDCGALPVALVPQSTHLDSGRLVLAPHSPGVPELEAYRG